MAGLFVFITLTTLVQGSIEKSAAKMGVVIKKLDQRLQTNSWQAAQQQLTQLERSWKSMKPFWSLLLNHREIDSIDQALVRTRQALLSKDLPATRIELGSLRHFLKHVPEREALNLVNIF